MGGGFNRIDLTNTSRIHQNPKVRYVLENYNWLGFFERSRGYDDEVSLDFSLDLQHPEGHKISNAFKFLNICLDEYLISKVTTLTKGMKRRKKGRHEAIISRIIFLLPNKNLRKIQKGNGEMLTTSKACKRRW